MEPAENEQEKLWQRMEDAAREGAREGAKEGVSQSGGRAGGRHAGLKFKIIAIALIVVLLAVVVFQAISPLLGTTRNSKGTSSAAEEHDLLLDDDGIWGYTAADFAEAVLGQTAHEKKLEVLSQEISDAATITDTGLFNLNIFTKTQLITYHGTALYTVDLSQVTSGDITLDKETKTITMYIPSAELSSINIPSEDIEFSDVSKGLLAFGDLKLTAEQQADVETAAREKMEEKLDEQNIQETANRFAVVVVMELYQPVITSVAQGCTLKVEVKD